jgi:serine/threonine protein kinase
LSDAGRVRALSRVGTTLHKWHVDRLIDIGGMAAVYAATHRNGNRVAIKVLHKEFAEHQDVKERFLREGYVANKVGHPGAVSVLDDDVADDGAAFLVMELLEGESLDGRLRRTKTLSPIEVLFVADQLLDVLAAAHEQGIVHRDIKPANVFITKTGQIKLLDFGLARVRDSGALHAATRDGVIMGTAAFMPPEQARGKTKEVDPRSDQWALGALMFTSLTGTFVHPGKSPMERLIAASKEPVRSIATALPDLQKPIVALIDRALAFDKADRFPDAKSMRAAVDAATVQLRKPATLPAKYDAPVIVELDSAELQESFSMAVSLLEESINSIPVELDAEVPSSHHVEDVGELPSVAVSMFEPEPSPKK